MNSREKWIGILTLALGIALLPPIWAVLSPHFGESTGAVALICAGVYVTNGNKIKDGVKISIGFLCGDLWAVLAIAIMDWLPWNSDLNLFLTLFVLGGVAVIIANLIPKIIFLPSWLCGWAIGLTIMGSLQHVNALSTLPIEIGVAMLAGVWYVGAGVDKFQRILVACIKKKK